MALAEKYTMRIVKGALLDSSTLNRFEPKVLEQFENHHWDCLIQVDLNFSDIKAVQKQMTRHYEDPTPWYMDGYATDNYDKILVAFGADDGEGGKIFRFKRDDRSAFKRVVEYAKSKGIPKEQMDFLEK